MVERILVKDEVPSSTLGDGSKIGRLAQLVQSVCLTSRGSAVRIRQRPLFNLALSSSG